MTTKQKTGKKHGKKPGENGESAKNGPLNTQVDCNQKTRDFCTGQADSLLSRREDWTEFRSLANIGRKAGVPPDKLAEVVAKELADNEFDASGWCRYGILDGNGFFVEGDGTGIPGTDEELADLFSVRRPLTSSKRTRQITRGALGHGLRVAAGAVLATDGRLTVSTRGRSLHLKPQENDGSTRIERVEPWEGMGTRVCIWFGPALEVTPTVFTWCNTALELAKTPGAKFYRKKSSPWWFDGDAFFEFLNSCGQHTIREVVKNLEGCSGRASGIARDYFSRSADSVSRDEADTLLNLARKQCSPVRAQRLGCVGRLERFVGYGKRYGAFDCKAGRSRIAAKIPFVMESWAAPAERSSVCICVNRTPVTAEVSLSRAGNDPTCHVVWGCNLNYRFKTVRNREFNILVNIICPYLPLTTDGKEPDLEPLSGPIVEALERSVRTAKTRLPSDRRDNAANVVIRKLLPDAINHASGDGQSRYGPRNLYYSVRHLAEAAGFPVPSWGWFQKVVGQVEEEQGCDLPGIARDNRGTLYHPHTHEEIPLGTITVEKYKRPAWTFNKILYCEKEGFFSIFKDARWPERRDCALLTSKGYASRAAKDVFDLLGETDEEIHFFCAHDADGPGTMIYEKLQNATLARPARNVNIINLGLEPEEGRRMGLQIESVTRKLNKKTGKPRKVPVASYVPAADKQWLQYHRIEMNSMTAPQYVAWTDQKFEEHGSGKVVPPQQFIEVALRETVRARIADAERERILREHDYAGQVEAAAKEIEAAVHRRANEMTGVIVQALKESPESSWRMPVSAAALELANQLYELRRLNVACVPEGAAAAELANSMKLAHLLGG